MEGLTVISVAILFLGIFLSVLGWFGVVVCAIRRKRLQRWFATAFVGALGWVGGAGTLMKQESMDKDNRDIERVRLDEHGNEVPLPITTPQEPAALDRDENKDDEDDEDSDAPPPIATPSGQTPPR